MIIDLTCIWISFFFFFVSLFSNLLIYSYLKKKKIKYNYVFVNFQQISLSKKLIQTHTCLDEAYFITY